MIFIANQNSMKGSTDVPGYSSDRSSWAVQLMMAYKHNQNWNTTNSQYNRIFDHQNPFAGFKVHNSKTTLMKTEWAKIKRRFFNWMNDSFFNCILIQANHCNQFVSKKVRKDFWNKQPKLLTVLSVQLS